jgi:hypothetical protein
MPRLLRARKRPSGKILTRTKGDRQMTKYKITLELTTEYNPNKWNWHEVLDLYPDEELFVAVEEMEKENV